MKEMSEEPNAEFEFHPVDENDDSPTGNEQTDGHDEAFSEGDVLDAPETRDAEMERLRRTADEADKRVLQAQAEAENFRKRMRRDYEDQIKFASQNLIVELLQVRDNLMRAIEAAATNEEAAGLREGVEMVAKQLDDVMGKYGVEHIPADGEVFDPEIHEAISQIPSDVEAGKVAHVAVSGFKLHDRVIRPSQVVVSTGPAN